MILEEQVKLLANIFKGRTDAFAIQRPDGSYICIKRPLTVNDYNDHVLGKTTLGIYLIHPENDTVNFTAIDLDSKDTSLLKRLIFAIRKSGLSDNQFLIEWSGSKGFHIFFLFEAPIPAKKGKALGDIIVKLAEVPDVEVFPKQITVGKGGFGNLIKLPLGIHRKSNKYSYFLTPDLKPTDILILEKISRITESKVDEITEEFDCRFDPVPTPQDNNQPHNNSNSLPCFSRMLQGVPEGCRDECAFHLGVHLKRQGFDKNMAINILFDWDDRNQPSLGKEIIKKKVEHVYNGQYGGYGCNNQKIKQFCSDRCPIRTYKKTGQ